MFNDTIHSHDITKGSRKTVNNVYFKGDRRNREVRQQVGPPDYTRKKVAACSSGVSSKCRAKACSISTVIRFCEVWLGSGFSSQKCSATWNLGWGPRPWKYLAKSLQKQVVLKSSTHLLLGNRCGPGPGGASGAFQEMGMEQRRCTKRPLELLATRMPFSIWFRRCWMGSDGSGLGNTTCSMLLVESESSATRRQSRLFTWTLPTTRPL